jgi:hypothetical protein
VPCVENTCGKSCRKYGESCNPGDCCGALTCVSAKCKRISEQ